MKDLWCSYLGMKNSVHGKVETVWDHPNRECQLMDWHRWTSKQCTKLSHKFEQVSKGKKPLQVLSVHIRGWVFLQLQSSYENHTCLVSYTIEHVEVRTCYELEFHRGQVQEFSYLDALGSIDLWQHIPKALVFCRIYQLCAIHSTTVMWSVTISSSTVDWLEQPRLSVVKAWVGIEFIEDGWQPIFVS